jgi:ABC-type polysaccharide/polyol phosphate export permease
VLRNLAGLWRHRALFYVLVARELKARYRGSVLGFFWSLLNPLLMLAVYAFVFAVIFQGRGASTSPYALFLFSGLLPWNWLSSALTDAASSLTTHGALLRKILFPAEVLPLVAVVAQGIHFVFAAPVLLLGLVLGSLGVFGTQVPIGWPLAQVLPLVVLEGVFLAGVGLFLAALTVHFRDVKDLLATALSLWFFATPVLYALTDIRSERLRTALSWNPATPFFEAWRDAFFRAAWIAPERWGVLAGIAFGAFLVGYALFDRLRDSFPEAV